MFPIIGDVVIRTNSKKTDLTVNAALDSVKHYGDVGTVTVEKVSDSSYYEFGNAKLVDVANGRVVVTNEKDASIGTIYLTATEDNYDSIILASMNGAEIPEVIYRDAVSNPTSAEQKKLIATIQQVNEKGESDISKEEKIYLYAQETAYEQNKGYSNVSDMGTLVLEAPVGENGQLSATNSIPEDMKAGAETFIATAIEEGKPTSNEVAVESKEDALVGASVFAGGLGTENSPWLIEDYATFQRVSEYFDEFHYYKVKPGVSTIDCSGWIPVKLNGCFDGAYGVDVNSQPLCVNLTNVDAQLFKFVRSLENNILSSKNNYIKNFSATFNSISNLDSANGMCREIDSNGITTLENIKLHGVIAGGNWTSSWICFESGNSFSGEQCANQEIHFINCTSDVNIVCGQSCLGTIMGLPTQVTHKYGWIVIDDIDKLYTGIISCNYKVQAFGRAATGVTNKDYNSKSGEYNDVVQKLGTTTITIGDNGYSVAKSPSATSCSVYVAAQLHGTDNSGATIEGQNGITMSIGHLGTFEYGQESNLKILNKISLIEYSNKQNEFGCNYKDGKLSVKVGTDTNYTFGTLKLAIIEFGASGNIISITYKNIANKPTYNGTWNIYSN